MDLSKSNLAIIGLGYVGLPLAVEFAKRRTVIGFDINPRARRISSLPAAVSLRAAKKPSYCLISSLLFLRLR